ncbi:DUF6428 family protein [Roseibacillus ishigakijimensis]|uniref:Uncharacterized protein n=1 Tax=Roseibacillus ishigakijimensis TaxID=454146 RepID=A0A934RUK6_9BACT|nr:DUF6428 family protein [Roseibacillus ishigakijimensis]MBK1835284.1 hypothetical protein [Roseibacillus ishigakijimensis]
MTIAELKAALHGHEDKTLQIQLPDKSLVPAHFHVTEVAFLKKDFVDCGGTVRHEGRCQLQAWVADDVDHRIPIGRFLEILAHGAPILPTEALPVEIEYEEAVISQYPLTGVAVGEEAVTLLVENRHTDCLAKDVCGLTPANSCAPGSGCC